MSEKIDMTAGRWMVSQIDDYEGLVCGSWATREEAIAAGPAAILATCGPGSESSCFWVGKLIPWKVRLPKGFVEEIAKRIHDETFRGFEEPPELAVNERDLEALMVLLMFWGRGARIAQGETFVGSFEEVPWPDA